MADSVVNLDFASYVEFDIWNVFSLDWWLHHLASSYRNNPMHMLTELALVILVLWLVFKEDQRKQPSDSDKLTVREQEELIREWQPEPLVPSSFTSTPSKSRKHSSSSSSSTPSSSYTINLSSSNYLAMAKDPRVLDAAERTIKKYAVGSCGPRGFYGTMDIHLALERTLSRFFGPGVEALIYADYVGCPASVITAFAKRGDLLLIDEGCHYLITQGAVLSRSNVIWFEHNNMAALEVCLQTVAEADAKSNRPVNRRFIVSEGVFHNHGDVCALAKLVELKETYKYRLILDDSHAIGTLHPKGTPGFVGVPHTKVDMYLGGLDTALGSTGGFCVGSKEITHHQTLSGAGYVFSASAPPFSCTAAQTVLEILEESGEEMVRELQTKATVMRRLLRDDDGKGKARWSLGDKGSVAPLMHLKLDAQFVSESEAEAYLERVAEGARREGVFVHCALYLPQEYGISDKADPAASLRICVTREHSMQQLESAARIIKRLLVEVGEVGQEVVEVIDEEKLEED